MKFAINYSHAAARLYDQGIIIPDLFKLPAWPQVIHELKDRYPLYVHFPLDVGTGIGDAMDSETGERADWAKIEQLLSLTQTPYINLHLTPPPSSASHDPQRILEAMIRDVEGVVARFGSEKVIVENGYDIGPAPLHPGYGAELVTQVVEATGCGFLFDLSHARMSALRLGQDYRAYIAQLPLHAIREIHITGMQVVDDYWVARAEAAGISREQIEAVFGPELAWLPQGMFDHLPMSAEDWEIMAWAAQQLQNGAWHTPWVIALECGGLGAIWAASFNEEEMREQVPRLQALFAGI